MWAVGAFYIANLMGFLVDVDSKATVEADSTGRRWNRGLSDSGF